MANFPNVLNLTQELIQCNTINPPGNELECVHLLANILENGGFKVTIQDFTPGRANLIAQLPASHESPLLCFSGHLDTVPLGAALWHYDPFGGEVFKDRIYGRGASDMKSGVAAIVVAALRIARNLAHPEIVLIFTAGEETGCMGAKLIEQLSGVVGNIGALIVAEPTSNYPILGHKGALWLDAVTCGVTAHGSMPEKGVNAIYKAARAVSKLETFAFEAREHPLLGKPTLNVGTISGGLNINSVPDEAHIGIDIRTTPEQSHKEIFEKITRLLGDDIELSKIIDVGPVWTPCENPWVQEVFETMADILGEQPEPRSVSYFTDAAVLTSLFGSPPTLILGPGEAAMAHQTDEYCCTDRIDQAVEIYERLGKVRCKR